MNKPNLHIFIYRFRGFKYSEGYQHAEPSKSNKTKKEK